MIWKTDRQRAVAQSNWSIMSSKNYDKGDLFSQIVRKRVSFSR